MAPGGGGKRKRGDRTYSGDARDDGQRPSPHRPEGLSLGQRTSQYQQPSQSFGRGGYNDRGRGNRRGSRAGYPTGSQRSPVQSPGKPKQSVPEGVEKRQENQIPQFEAPGPAKSEPASQKAITMAAEPDSGFFPARPLLAYDYQYLEDDIIGNWDPSGRDEILTKASELRDCNDTLGLSSLYQELLHATIDSHLDPAQSGSLIRDIIGNSDQERGEEYAEGDARAQVATTFLDVYEVFMEDVGLSPKLTELLEASKIPINKICRILDFELLQDLGLLRPGRPGNKPRGKHATQSLYRQSNYNLLREESEGYSKLITNLFSTSNNEPPTSEAVEQAVERIRGMIGAFDLDVGRVLDITLDVFAAVLVKQYRFFVKYLRASSWWPQDGVASYTAAQSALGPLPRWALPGQEGGLLSDGEKELADKMKTQRDLEFWPRCRKKGIDAFFELGGRRATDEQLASALDEGKKPHHRREQEYQNWVRITQTLPPTGNEVAAQILGFKLRFYNSPSRNKNDVLPVNLIYLAALLIKIGFITLKDLYPHLWPDDEAMSAVKEEKFKEKAEKEKMNRPGGGMNALLAAAPLPDDTIDPLPRDANRLKELEAHKRQQRPEANGRSTPVTQVEDSEALPESVDQKVQLLRSLLCIGALPEALYMLGRFPWLADAFTDLPEYIHRILHHCISKVYDSFRPLKDETGLHESGQMLDLDKTNLPKGSLRLCDIPPKRILRWAQLDRDDTGEGADYRFYWDDWADIIPVCQNVDDIFTLCSTLLNFSGVKIGQDPALLHKLARIGSLSLKDDPSPENYKRWIDLSKRLLVPALSLTRSNPGIVNEVFELLKNFSESTRYSIYSEWTYGQTSRLPDIRSAFDQTKAEARDVLKRMSKTTIKPSARALAKVAYASPGVVFSVAISQLESYENIVDTFVECARYFTYLAYDVLTWSLVSSLGQQGRNRIQTDGILTSKWLASLALFSGKVFKRYHTMDPLPIVQYVESQVRQGNPADLVVLEDIIKSMAGIISDVHYSESQVAAMSGLETLQSQTRQQLLDKRHESKLSAKRLMKPLIESGLAGQMLIALAQERKMCIFRVDEENAHPKLLGNLVDQMQRSLGQYIELLRTNLTAESFTQLIPETSRLVTEFGIDPSIAFWIWRKGIADAMDEYEKTHAVKQSQENLGSLGSPGEKASDLEDHAMIDAKDESANDNDTVDITTAGKSTAPDSDVDSKVEGQENSSAASQSHTQRGSSTDLSEPVSNLSQTPNPDSPTCHPVLQTIWDQMKSAFPADMFSALNPGFYVTFWQLSVQDLHMNSPAYGDEVKRLNDKIKTIREDRSDMSSAAVDRRKKELASLTELSAKITEEMGQHFSYMFTFRKTRLRPIKDQWFLGGTFDERHIALIEHCLFPRMIMSPLDSRFAFQMIRFLHIQSAANFRTMGLYDQFFKEKRLISLIFLCSSREAECLGRFINDVFGELSKWHADKKVYENEAYGPKKQYEGFSQKKKGPEGKEPIVEFLSFEDFRRLLLKWHRALNMALKSCFAGGEYMHIRNAINVLNSVHQHFPAINWMGQNQLTAVTELSKNDPREDLKLAAMSLIGTLKRREKQWVLPQAFSLVSFGIEPRIRLLTAKDGWPVRVQGHTANLFRKICDTATKWRNKATGSKGCRV